MNRTKILWTVLSLALLAAVPLSVKAEGGAPIAENMELQTYRGICMDGQLQATDPEGDRILRYTLATPPVKGEVIIQEDGSFRYTPKPGKRGKDYFGYTATDDKGNVSQEATVIITLMKQKTDVFYSDLADNSSHFSALRLAEDGIFVGEQIGGAYIFSPNTMISRGEFLSMCMTLSRQGLLSGVSDTGYSDDANIPDWQKHYIATALKTDAISHVNETGSTNFDATAPITCAQAAVMIDNIFQLSTVSAANLQGYTPKWAEQSVANLLACNVLTEDWDAEQYLNREMTADLLSAVMDILEHRS